MGEGLVLWGRRLDGSEFPVEISLSPILIEDRVLVAAAIRDVTDRKVVEAELVATREVAVRARESADRANQAKSRFLSTASHDLRQPLQALALLNGTLRRIVSDPDAIEAVEQQDLAITSMSRLLNALLDVSKLESGAITPALVDFAVDDVFAELNRDFAGVTAGKGLQLCIERGGEWVRSDRLLVEQLLRNLVANAVKYTQRGGITLSCRREEQSVRIEVTDTGAGIAAEHLPYIYDEFFQVGARSNSSREGYGLGLSIVVRIVNLLRLHLDVKSELGKGTTFILTVPRGEVCQDAGLQVSAVGSVTDAKPRAVRVLLVEDDAAVRNATRLLLLADGYRVTAVSSMAEALHSVQVDEFPDLVLTDYHLSDGETGTQVIAALRDMTATGLKAILTTGDTSSAVKNLPQDSDLRVASKPIHADDLLALLRDLLAS